MGRLALIRGRLALAHACAALALAACSDPVAPRALPTSPNGLVVAAGPTVTAIGNILGNGINDAGTIAGPSDGNRSSAYLWDTATGLKLVATGGLAWDVSQDGLTVGGKNAAGTPVLWTSASVGGTRTEVALPDAGFGGAVRSIVSDAGGAALVLVGNVFTNGSNKTPARWSRCTLEPGCLNGWLLATVEPTPPITEAWGQDVNAAGMIVGMEGTGCCRAAFWDSDGTQTVLTPLAAGAAASAWGINDAGTLIVGQSNGAAVMWVRSNTTLPFAAPIRLDGGSCKSSASSIAYALNPDLESAGTIVGQTCGSPVAWKVNIAVSPPTVLRVMLPSTGKSTLGVAQSINRSTSSRHRIAGQVNGTGVYWTSF